MSHPRLECCEEIKKNSCAFEFNWVVGSGEDTHVINLSTCDDHWYELEDVKYCPFCGTNLFAVHASGEKHGN